MHWARLVQLIRSYPGCTVSTPVSTFIDSHSGNTFLRYIRTQVQDFARGVSNNLMQSEDFFTVPSATSLEDPRTSIHRFNLAGRGFS